MDQQWIVTKVDGKVASVGMDYRGTARVLGELVKLPKTSVNEVVTCKIDTDALYALSASLQWEDLRLFGSPFQLSVWHALFDLTHSGEPVKILSYTDFAEQIGKASGVRAVAHALACNPVPVIVPCHLVIPKESLERIQAIQKENGLFSWKALYIVDSRIDYGEYALGPALKRELILRELA